MTSYTDKDFRPKREFWNAMTSSFECPSCGYSSNGFFRVWELLEGPLEAECHRCQHQWSVAIPLGPCPERQRILDLLEAEKRFYALRDDLANTIDILHGRPPNANLDGT